MDNFSVKMCGVCAKKTKMPIDWRLKLANSNDINIIYCCPLCLEYFALLSLSPCSPHFGFVYSSEILPLFLRISDKFFTSDEIISSYSRDLSLLNSKFESSLDEFPISDILFNKDSRNNNEKWLKIFNHHEVIDE